jgi:hypothetical protein
MGTLKAEMSQLRDILGGLLGSRPYRLHIPHRALVQLVKNRLQHAQADDMDVNQVNRLKSKTESPFLCAWRDCLESRLSDAIFKTQETDLLLKH